MKLLSMIGAAIVGGVLAFLAVHGVVASATAAPSNNPANAPVVHYGDR